MFNLSRPADVRDAAQNGFQHRSQDLVARQMKYTIECFTDASSFERLRSEWLALERKLTPRSPFTSPYWHETWWSHLRRVTWDVRDDLALHTVRNQQGELVAVAPFMLTRRPGFGVLQIAELQALGADPNVTELRNVICAQEDVGTVMPALREHFKSAYPRATWVTWFNVPWMAEADGHAAPEGIEPQRFIWQRPQPAYVVDMADTWKTFEGGLPKRVRKKMRNCYNQLERAKHAFELSVAAKPEDVSQSLQRFYDRVDLRSQVRHANPFAREDMRTFFNDYASQSAARGEIKVFELRVDGAYAASRIGFALGNELYLYHSGNLPEWDKFSIMTTLLAEIFKWAISNGFKLVNLSTGLDRSKTRWAPRELMLVDAVEIMPGRVKSVLYKGYMRIKTMRKPPLKDPVELEQGRFFVKNYSSKAEALDDN